MPTLTSFDRLPSFSSLRTDLTKFGAASTLAESSLLLFSEQSETDAKLYKTVTHFLGAIDSASSPRETLKVLTQALTSLLALSGFGSLNDDEGPTLPAKNPRPSSPDTDLLAPSPRLLRLAMAEIERATNKELRTAPTINRMLAELPLRR